MAQDQKEITLSQAALLARMDYQSARNAVLRGDFSGRQVGTRWVVDRDSVLRYLASAAKPEAVR